jgi:hypothetical protein
MGNASSELQHIANTLSLMGPEEKKFMEAVLHGRLLVSTFTARPHQNGLMRSACNSTGELGVLAALLYDLERRGGALY